MKASKLLQSFISVGLGLVSSNAAAITTSELFQALNVIPISEYRVDGLSNLSFKTHYTTSGVIHVDEANQVVIADGKLFKMGTGQLSDVTVATNKSELEKVPQKIVYKAPNEIAKVQVFTDISCPQCQKLHQNIEQYNQAGITLEFILYSRNGIDAPAFFQMSSFENRASDKGALEEAMSGEYVFAEKEPSKQMLRHQMLGFSLKVNKTPSMYFDGYYLKYQAPEVLLKMIDQIRSDSQ